MLSNNIVASRLATLLFIFFMVQNVSGQEYSAGIKGGFNYSLGNDGSEIAGSLGQFSAKSDVGYLFGVFGEIGYKNFFFRPEIFYSTVAAKFEIEDSDLAYKLSKINIPLIFGYNIYGPIDIYAGPSYQKITNVELDRVKEIDLDQKNFNAHFGIKFIYTNWEVDLRYEFAPSSDYNQIIDIENLMDNAYFDDGRLNNIMLTLNYKLFDSENYSSEEVVDE